MITRSTSAAAIGDIVECTLVEPDVEFTAQGETAQVEVSPVESFKIEATIASC